MILNGNFVQIFDSQCIDEVTKLFEYHLNILRGNIIQLLLFIGEFE